jgi:hypothetical protein
MLTALGVHWAVGIVEAGGIAINHYQVGDPPFVFGIRSIDPAKAECVGYSVILWPHTILSSPAGLAVKEPHRDLQTFEFCLLLTPNQTGKHFN